MCLTMNVEVLMLMVDCCFDRPCRLLLLESPMIWLDLVTGMRCISAVQEERHEEGRRANLLTGRLTMTLTFMVMTLTLTAKVKAWTIQNTKTIGE